MVNEGYSNGCKKLLVSYNASDLMAIDSKSCEGSISGEVSGTRYRQISSILEESLENRSPLMDCTNILSR